MLILDIESMSLLMLLTRAYICVRLIDKFVDVVYGIVSIMYKFVCQLLALVWKQFFFFRKYLC